MSENFISLLPFYNFPTSFLVCDKLPCHAEKIERIAIENILLQLKRKKLAEALYVSNNDLPKIKRYKTINGDYKNDFNKAQFLEWVKIIENNTAICDMENAKVGKGIFVPPGRTLPKGTFIPSSGVIKLNPSREDLETKNHCSALQDLSSVDKTIYGFIDPEERGGILDLINHAPNEEEMINFEFKDLSTEKNVATSNLKCVIKFYNGYAIMGVEAFQDISGGLHGKQLLWSYAQPDEYVSELKLDSPKLVLFDKRDEHNGEVIDSSKYSLKKIDIFFDTGEMTLRKIASLTRWELMESAPKEKFTFSITDPYSSVQSDIISSSISNRFLQVYLSQNVMADRIIIPVPTFDADKRFI